MKPLTKLKKKSNKFFKIPKSDYCISTVEDLLNAVEIAGGSIQFYTNNKLYRIEIIK